MNKNATNFSLKNSHFSNPHGLLDNFKEFKNLELSLI